MQEKQAKEVDVFNKYSRHNKFRILILGILLSAVVVVSFYFFAKSLFQYTVTYELNGGTVLDQLLPPKEYKFLERVLEPQKVKKEGYYIEKWSTNENLSDTYEFGNFIWHDMTLYVDWQDGFAVRLHFGNGEENADLNTHDLKMYYEQYYKPGTVCGLPKVFNNKNGSSHFGEQLLWFENPECEGDPIMDKDYLLDKNYDVYGRWFDTQESKFQVEDGTLIRYEGDCENIIFPESITKIRSIEVDKFKTGNSDQYHDLMDRSYTSVFSNVLGTVRNIYLNKNLREIGDCAFRELSVLERVYFLGDNVEKLGKWAFANCKSLQAFTVPSKVTIIPEYCFMGAGESETSGCLDTVIVPNSVKTIGKNAFSGSSIREISLGGVTEIEELAFAGCNRLKKVELKIGKLVTNNNTQVDKNVFFGTADHSFDRLKIYVPASLLNTYKTTSPWNIYSEYYFAL